MQVNPDNSRGIRALTFLLFKYNTLKKKQQQQILVKVYVSRSHGEMASGVLNLHHDGDFRGASSQSSITWYKSANRRTGIPAVYES